MEAANEPFRSAAGGTAPTAAAMSSAQGKRDWCSWPHRFFESFSRAEIIVGLTSVGLTVFGSLASQPLLQVPGILVLVGIPIILACRSFPGRLLSVSSLATSQKPITLDQLGQLDAAVVSIGTVGEKRSGKSTFLQYALQRTLDPKKTTRIEARIVPVPNAVPQVFCALVDGDGGQLSQQFDVCDHVDLLFVFLDHSPSDQDPVLARGRLPSHDSFLSQLRSHLSREGRAAPRRIHFVLNKRDLWETDAETEEVMVPWFCAVVTAWRSYGMAPTVTSSRHSNWDAKDVQEMLRTITDSVSG